MGIICEYGGRDAAGKIICSKRDCFCGHAYFCELSGTYKQTRGAEKCPVRFEVEKPEKAKKKGKKK